MGKRLFWQLFPSYLLIALVSLFIGAWHASIIAGLIAVILSFIISRGISRKLQELEEGARRFACGNLKSRLPVSGSKEISGLARAMNEMAAQLDNKISHIIRQSNEQEAVLSSMTEGVIAIDNQERIIKLNRASAKLLGLSQSEVQGRKIQEIIRNSDLHQFVLKALSSQNHVEGDVTVYNCGKERFLQARSSVLRDADGNNIGALIVLNDITGIRKLENMRSDFISNVSHELRTPVTSIKGYTETLLDGAMHDSENLKHFLEIILNQSNRLNTIIEDLLSLSRLDQESGNGELQLEKTIIKDILNSAIQECAVKSAPKNINLEISSADDVQLMVSPSLMEQALINLIDNAVKYSKSNSTVLIEALCINNEVVIKVTDQGCGISKEHLPRIFERFYRVDKARSRQLGGTGLGLAIVKHICQVHGGHINVDSTVGVGSTFSIHLPHSF